MNTPAITNGPVSEALYIKVNTDIAIGLHEFFTVRYSNEPADNIIHQLANVATPSLQSQQLFESWHGTINSTSNFEGWRLFQNDQYLLACVPEKLITNLPIDQAAEIAYSAIFEQMNAYGYSYLVRTWNFFPGITSDGYAGANNYQLFCTGRSRAYENQALAEQSYPAATVIGTQQTGVQIFFIAAKQAGIGLENSLQVSAFDYPSIYSQDPPLFSRALLHRNNSQEILFVSGTASITGHDTQYAGDINRQTEICLSNIEQLITTAVIEHNMIPITLRNFSQFKVYIKNPNDIDTVRTHIQQVLGPSAPVYYLHGDMCRSDLSVEIEALAIIPVM
jgi:chorismate lyase / 3-hydroxybenzoate synthase